VDGDPEVVYRGVVLCSMRGSIVGG
jgi:hypothetical protein